MTKFDLGSQDRKRGGEKVVLGLGQGRWCWGEKLRPAFSLSLSLPPARFGSASLFPEGIRKYLVFA